MSVDLVSTRERKAQTSGIDEVVLFAPGHGITQIAVTHAKLKRQKASDCCRNIAIKSGIRLRLRAPRARCSDSERAYFGDSHQALCGAPVNSE
jgi:hypothetical protein